jgi:mannose-6-phosphate isomerase-like protein (cupin superfamily)
MQGFRVDIEDVTESNTNFRKVLFTGTKCQLVVMSINPGESIGVETHPSTDQFIRIEEGEGLAIIDGKTFDLEPGMAIVIPAGAKHNVINTSNEEALRLYTVYSPPNHPDKLVQKTKQAH